MPNGTITTASHEWSTRPADERFTSLPALAAYTAAKRQATRRKTLANRALTVAPATDDRMDVVVNGPNGHPAHFTHWSFGQLCSLAGIPAQFMRDGRMPGALIADNLNWFLHHQRPVEDVSVAIRRAMSPTDKPVTLASVNGPNYGVVWDADIADALVHNFYNSQWTIPGEFGHAVEITNSNTTLYAGDRSMFAFLADETRRIDIPNRRNGETGSLARGFYISNSETGAGRLVLGMFLFDYVCCNRIIWGAQNYQEIAFKHTASAPSRWVEEVKPILTEFANSSPRGISETIAAARTRKIETDVETFLTTRFGTKAIASHIQATHMLEEGRPVEFLMDAINGATAYARQLVHVDARTDLERRAGDLLKLAA